MTDPRMPLLQPDQERHGKRRALEPDFYLGWQLLLAVGWLFIVIGMLSIVLIWIPLQIGSPEFEFASVAASFDSLLVPILGFVLALAASRALGKERMAQLTIALVVLLVILILLAAALYALNVPMALRVAVAPEPRLAIRKSIVKVVVQTIAYPVALLSFARMARRHVGRIS